MQPLMLQFFVRVASKAVLAHYFLCLSSVSSDQRVSKKCKVFKSGETQRAVFQQPIIFIVNVSENDQDVSKAEKTFKYFFVFSWEI